MIKEGTVRFHVPDRYTLEVSEDKHIELEFRPELPINVQVMLDLETYEYVVLPEQPMSQIQTNKHIAIYYLRPCATDKELADAQKHVDRFAKEVYNFWQTFAGKWWDIKVSGHVLNMNMCPYGPHTYCKTEMRQAHSLLEDAPFEPNYWHIIGGGHNIYCGQATVGGTVGVTYSCSPTTTCHELGHNFGLLHSSSLKANGDIDEYGDGTSIMARSSSGATGLSAMNRYILGLYYEDEFKEIRESEQVLLSPSEMDYLSKNPNEFSIVRIAKKYFVSIRKCDETAYSITGNAKGFVYIHEQRGVGSLLLGRIAVGDTYDELDGIKIKYLDNINETAKVDVIFNDVPVPKQYEIAKGFPVVEESAISKEHQGAWHDPDREGQGLDLYIKGDRLVLAWYTYNTRNKLQRFYTATCKISEAHKSFEIRTTLDGTLADPAKHKSIVVGAGQLYFNQDGTGVFNFNLTDGLIGRNTLRLSRVLTSTHPDDGLFYEKTRDGEGVAIHFLPDNKFSAFWYTYGPKVSAGWGKEYPDTQTTTQRWYVINGELGKSADILEVSELTFMGICKKEHLRTKKVGTATIGFADDSISLKYSLNKTEGIINMERLF